MKHKEVLIALILWTFLHVVLFSFTDSSYAKEYFWPFNDESKLKDYDITEFLTYAGIPWMIYVVMILMKKRG